MVSDGALRVGDAALRVSDAARLVTARRTHAFAALVRRSEASARPPRRRRPTKRDDGLLAVRAHVGVDGSMRRRHGDERRGV